LLFVFPKQPVFLALSATRSRLINLLLLVDAVFSWTAVDQEEEAADNGQDLEEVVLGEVLVWVCVVEL
jgi:hypothetical protein